MPNLGLAEEQRSEKNKDLRNDGLYSEKYNSQVTVSCGSDRISIPRYLPNVHNNKEGLYIMTSSRSCNDYNLEVIWALSADCQGQNYCSQGSFARNKVGAILRNNIETTFSNLYETINLTENIQGYFMPSQCFSYCTEAKLFWFDNDYIFTLGTKIVVNQPTVKEQLIKSANSYIMERQE